MAELVLKHMIRTEGLTGITVNSVAVSREEEGKPVYPPARRELERHGIAVEHRRARRITQQDVDSYDRIYYMDSRNARYLEQLFPGEEKFQKFLPRDVADPWYSGDFTQTWEDIWEGCGKILEELR
jgi:protein-tyrosine phosphatase